MNFNNFKNKIEQLKTAKLEGLAAQFKMAPKLRLQFNEDIIKSKKPKKAAVLVLFYPNKNNETCVLLTKRATYNGNHSAQISFPGGKVEKEDTSVLETAIREANEEIGIEKEVVNIIRVMSKNYIPPSNFLVTPVLGYTEITPQFIINYEVEEIITIPLRDLLNDSKETTIIKETSYMKSIEVPCYNFNNHIVWGATAMMLSEIKELLKTSYS